MFQINRIIDNDSYEIRKEGVAAAFVVKRGNKWVGYLRGKNGNSPRAASDSDLGLALGLVLHRLIEESLLDETKPKDPPGLNQMLSRNAHTRA